MDSYVSKFQQAITNFKSGMNCAQAVICTYAKELNLDETTAFKIAEGFGGGMGAGSVCGALTGVFTLLGLLNSSGSPQNITKGQTIRLVQSAWKQFEELNGSTLCEVLKGRTGNPPVPCTKCIEDACKLFEKIQLEHQSNK